MMQHLGSVRPRGEHLAAQRRGRVHAAAGVAAAADDVPPRCSTTWCGCRSPPRRSYDLLVREFGPAHYRRVVLPDHGHQDTFIGAPLGRRRLPRGPRPPRPRRRLTRARGHVPRPRRSTRAHIRLRHGRRDDPRRSGSGSPHRLASEMRVCLAQDFRSARSSMFSRRNLCSSAWSDSLIWAGLARRSRGLSSSPAPPRSTLGPSTLQTSSCRPYNTSSARPIGSTPSRTISRRRRPATTWTPETRRPRTESLPDPRADPGRGSRCPGALQSCGVSASRAATRRGH